MCYRVNIENKQILVVGMGRSGIAAAQILRRRNALVSICDKKSAYEINIDLNELEADGIKVYTGEYPPVTREHFDLLVASPGIPLNIKPFQQAYHEGIAIIGEIELAYQLKNCNTVLYAVTGTNGKTTTIALLQKIMKNDGRVSIYGGNIGVPLTAVVDRVEETVISVEVSSFQLETIADFRPSICGILNITPDHLDRHKSMEAYINTKGRILENQKEEDFAVINYDDPILREMAKKCKSRVFYFSIDKKFTNGAFIEDKCISVSVENKKVRICSAEDLCLRGKHNLENVLCAAMMSYLGGAKIEAIAETLTTFKGVRHRMEEVIYQDEILYINDSKATNPESVIKALESFDNPVILIAGGRNKGSDFAKLAAVIKEKVVELVLVGEAKEEIEQAVMDKNYQNIHEVEGFEDAVITAHKLAHPGDVVLLSPACASWDMFSSYEHRGDMFCDVVKSILDSK